MTDSISDLAHDHHELNRHVLAAGSALRALLRDPAARPAFETALSNLHDLLFDHFAREEEAMFPFIADAFADLATRVHDMTIAHDTICGALTRALHLANNTGEAEPIRALYERFEQAYAGHAALEATLLRELDQRLSSAQREQLGSLLEDL